jgi:hypothetical protein
VWPTWLGKFIPKDAPNYSASSTIIYAEGTDVTRRIVNGDSKSRRVKRVCGDCNNGWMSRLQKRAKPIVLSLALGEQATLDKEAQRTLAAWSAMSTMTSDHFYPSRAAIPQRHRETLRLNNSLPEGEWKIWIGHYERGDWVPDWVRNAMAIWSDEHPPSYLADTFPVMNTQTTTLVFGKLYVHTFSSVHSDLVSITGQPNEKLVQLWPCTSGHSIRWPLLAMTDRDADDAAGFIFKALDKAT